MNITQTKLYLALTALVAILIGFGSGVLVGRHFPAHYYKRLGNTNYLYDPATGKACNPFLNPEQNPVDQVFSSQGSTPPYPPACPK